MRIEVCVGVLALVFVIGVIEANTSASGKQNSVRGTGSIRGVRSEQVNASPSNFEIETDAENDTGSAGDDTARSLPAIPIGIAPKPLDYNPDECLKDWTSLKSAMILSAVLTPNLPPEFTLCPGRIFLLDDTSGGGASFLQPIEVQKSNSVFRCGDDGKQENNCLVVGGYAHFKMVGSVQGVSFIGLTFTGARLASILATGESDAEAKFVDCAWVDNKGAAAILVYNEEKGVPISIETNVENLVEPRAQSMTVSCDGCLFSKNNLKNSTVVNLSGEISLQASVFAENEVLGGAIITRFESSLIVENSCFIRNKAKLAGIVVVNERSKVKSNKNTYGYENEIEYGSCKEVFYEVGGSCVGGANPTCVGLCGFFTSSGGCPIALGRIKTLDGLLEEIKQQNEGEKGGSNGTKPSEEKSNDKIFGADPLGVLVGGGFGLTLIALCCMGCSFRFGQKSVFAKYAAVPIRDDNVGENSNRPITRPPSHNPNVQVQATRPPVVATVSPPMEDTRPTQPKDTFIEDATPVGRPVGRPVCKEDTRPSVDSKHGKDENRAHAKLKKYRWNLDDSSALAFIPGVAKMNPFAKKLGMNGNDSDDSDDSDDTGGAFFSMHKNKKKNKKSVGKGGDTNESKKKASTEDLKKSNKLSAGGDEKKNEDSSDYGRANDEPSSSDSESDSNDEELMRRSSSKKSSHDKKRKEKIEGSDDENNDFLKSGKRTPRDKKKKDPDSGVGDSNSRRRSASSSRDKKKKKEEEMDESDVDEGGNAGVDEGKSRRSSANSSRDRKKKKKEIGESDGDEGGKMGSEKKSSHDSKKKKIYSETSDDNEGESRRSSGKSSRHKKELGDPASDTDGENDKERSSSKSGQRHDEKKKKTRKTETTENDSAHGKSVRSSKSKSFRDKKKNSMQDSYDGDKKHISTASKNKASQDKERKAVGDEIDGNSRSASRIKNSVDEDKKVKPASNIADDRVKSPAKEKERKGDKADRKKSDSEGEPHRSSQSDSDSTTDSSRRDSLSSVSSKNSSVQGSDQSKRQSIGSDVSGTTSASGASNGSSDASPTTRTSSRYKSREKKRNSIDFASVSERRNSLGILVKSYASVNEKKDKLSKERATQERSKSPPVPGLQKKETNRAKDRSISPASSRRDSLSSNRSRNTEYSKSEDDRSKDSSKSPPPNRSKRGSLGSNKSRKKKESKESGLSESGTRRSSLKDNSHKSTNKIRSPREEEAEAKRRKSRDQMKKSLSNIDESNSLSKKEQVLADMAKLSKDYQRAHGSRDRFGSNSIKKRNELQRKPMNTSSLKPFDLKDLKMSAKSESKEEK